MKRSIDAQALSAAGRVEHNGLQIGTRCAAEVLRAYQAAKSADEHGADELALVLNELNSQIPMANHWLRLMRVPTMDYEDASELIDLVSEDDAYAPIEPVGDFAPASLWYIGRTTAGERWSRAENAHWQLVLGLDLQGWHQFWPGGIMAMLWQRVDRSVGGVLLAGPSLHGQPELSGRSRSVNMRTRVEVQFRSVKLLRS